MASFVPSVTFCFGSDGQVTLPESLLACPPVGGITFGSFTDSAFVTLGGPTPSEAAALSPPQRRARAAMRPFVRPAARRTARAPVRPTPVRVQQAHPVARQAVPRPPPVQPTRPVARRPVPPVPVAPAVPAPQRRQPVVPSVVVPAEVTRTRVSPPPSSSRKRSAQAELPSLSTRRVSAFARLSHPEIVRQTPTPPVPVTPVPAVVPQAVGPDLPSSSTSGLGRRARRNRNRRLRLAASEAEQQQMAVSLAHQEPGQQRVAPPQREPRLPLDTPTLEIVVAPEIEAVQGGRFSPLTHSCDEEDVARIAAAPPVTTTLRRARVPRDGAARTLTQRIRSIIRLARRRGPVSRERLLQQISQVHTPSQRQLSRQRHQWRRGQPPRQQTTTPTPAGPQSGAPTVGRRPRRRGRRQQLEPARPRLSSVVVAPPPIETVVESRRSRWVWRRRQADPPAEVVQPVGQSNAVAPQQSEAVLMLEDGLTDVDEVSPPGSLAVRAEPAPAFSPFRASSSMGPYIEALRQNFSDRDFLDEGSEDDLLGDGLDEDIPVHRVCVVTRRGHSGEQREFEDDDEEQGDTEIGGSPRSVDTDATVLQLQAQMAEMAKAMATMTAQLTALGAVPQAAGVGTPATSRDEAVVPPVLAPGPVGVDRVQRTVPVAPTTVTHSLPVQSQPAQSQLVQMTASQIQDLIAQKVEQAISSRKSGEAVSRGRPYPVEYEQEPYPPGFVPPRFRVFDGFGNPRQHVAQYRAICCNIGGNDALMLRLFVSSLVGVAFAWYADLPNDSVRTFAELEQLFVQRFVSAEHRVTVGELVVARQRPHESLQDYIVRWRNLSLQCEPQLQEQHAVEILLKNIDGPIAPYLKGFSIRTFQKLLTKVVSLQDSIPAAVPPKVESQQSRRPQRQESSGAPPPRRGEVHSTYGPQDKGKKPLVSSVPPPQQQQPHTQGQSAAPPRPSRRTPESQQYLQEKLSKEYPFKRESVKKIFKFLIKKNILSFPTNNRVEEEGKVEHPLYCPFHRHIGHVIEDCYVFKDRVERLLASGQIHLQDSDLVQPKGKAAQVVQTVSDVSQRVSQCDSQSSSSKSPCGSEGEWQLALSRKTKSMI
ncbi:hypothetical protein M5K25_022868 [Dendrobium thyrsiflorum]|uniref:Retrotransposon gag domain-containing protein n=1 Tax=Dendrobium thyrsiflorum TaxID=117978 RepID=A0ABD0UDC8_DENTH